MQKRRIRTYKELETNRNYILDRNEAVEVDLELQQKNRRNKEHDLNSMCEFSLTMLCTLWSNRVQP